MEEFKGTKGPLEKKFVGPICIGIGTVGDYSQITANSILPETDAEYEEEKIELEANMQLYAAAPDLLEALQEMMKAYKEIADSGDCGWWKAEEQDEFIKAQKAINKAFGK